MNKARDSKPHIGIFGRRNNGKSSFINALTGQDTAIVSAIPGTTTDPVKKSIEIDGVGPVVMIDTAGNDDSGELGLKRIGKTLEALKIIDLAILVMAHNEFDEPEKALIHNFRENNLPFFILYNKADEEAISPELERVIRERYQAPLVTFSSLHPRNLNEVAKIIRETMPETIFHKQTLLGDLIRKDDVVLLITPIDIEAPEGRMILPQVQVIRDVLDHDGIAVLCKESEVEAFVRTMNPKPVLAITDSQAFARANAAIPPEIPLTSFSIVLAHQKGDFENYLKGTSHISRLRDGDRVLILESCTHHLTCDDIGRVKIPRWLTNFTGKKLEFEVIAGLGTIPSPITDFSLVIQCGGCMITHRQIINRLKPAIDAGIPVTNYGFAIAYMHGIYDRAIQPFRKEEKG
ncbi:MAG: [FeFe] hydrogenase H-cluster maturation GTPase HydF [Bacteroidales bacterium]|nr:[FeFe] hydrogenase H-cluster maturation GTPase HydF [Bacteroidales bacterium]